MATDATATIARGSGSWTPARIFMVISAAYHLPLAIVGLAIDRTFPVGASAAAQAPSEFAFGLFETNGWHSLAALILGFASVYFAVRPDGARAAALSIGIGHVLIVVAFALQPPSTFWFASNGADQIVHVFTAIGGIASAMLTRRRRLR